jgi:hypothetical protein
MRIARDRPVGVADIEDDAVGVVAPGEGHRAARRGAHRRAGGRAQVHPGVKHAAALAEAG